MRFSVFKNDSFRNLFYILLTLLNHKNQFKVAFYEYKLEEIKVIIYYSKLSIHKTYSQKTQKLL